MLYNPASNVVGFVELKNEVDTTAVKIKHSLADPDTMLTLNGEVVGPIIAPALDLDAEIVACIVKREGKELATLASGIINPIIMQKREFDNGVTSRVVSKSLSNLPPIKAMLRDTAKTPIERNIAKSAAAREIDNILRAVCKIDDAGKGMCECCPYRDFFFGDRVIEQNDHALVNRPDCNQGACI